jgi:hypothetical protein
LQDCQFEPLEAHQKHQKENKHATCITLEGSRPASDRKDNSSTASRRDSHPARKATQAENKALVADHSISGFDTGTLGSESFPKKSTGDKGVAALEAQIKSNRPGVTPKR